MGRQEMLDRLTRERFGPPGSADMDHKTFLRRLGRERPSTPARERKRDAARD